MMRNCEYLKTSDGRCYCPVCDPRQLRTLAEPWPRNCHAKKAKTVEQNTNHAFLHRSCGGPGTELKKLLSKIGIRPTSDCKCHKRAAMMDAYGADWCEQNTEKVVGWLKEESNRRGLPFIKSAGRILIRRAIKNSRRSHSQKKKTDTEEKSGMPKKKPARAKPGITWAYGVTTVPARKELLLPRTLASLAEGGFPNPRLFVDGVKDANDYNGFGKEVTVHWPKIQAFGSWILALWELYVRDGTAGRYAIFQDDFVTYKNLRQYLERCEYPRNGYMNLYTFPKNQKLAPKDGKPGWFAASQNGLGAVALVFSREAVVTLLGSMHILKRPQGATLRKFKAIDGAVVDAFRKAGWKEYTHNPSLVQHTGKKSTVGNNEQALASSFKGEGFDALELLK